MKNNINVQFLCKDCENYNRCEYYYNRKENSYICKNFHLPNKLDKIRAEIDQYLFQNEFGSAYRKEVSQIIDKYKAESEDKE